MWSKFRKEKKVVKFEFGGNNITRFFFPLILVYFIALSGFSFRFNRGLNRKVNN